jgi:predicted transcriptional regulator
MQDQPNETVAEQGRRTEQTILTLVLSGAQSIWSVEELASEIGRRMDTVDALATLQAAGLVHRCQDFVFATRAALRFDELDL